MAGREMRLGYPFDIVDTLQSHENVGADKDVRQIRHLVCH